MCKKVALVSGLVVLSRKCLCFKQGTPYVFILYRASEINAADTWTYK